MIEMRKLTFLIIVFAILILTTIQLASADYSITNGSTTETAWVIYSVWSPAGNGWPAGWRTRGWFEIKPDDTVNLSVPEQSPSVYIRVERPYRTEIKPPDHTTRESSQFWIHPSNQFIVVENSKGKILRSNRGRSYLKQVVLYKYPRGGSHIINESTQFNEDLNLTPEQIYERAMPSVVWIYNFEAESEGSGVLIDQERKLAVTNAHVTESAEWVLVCFPVPRPNGEFIGSRDYYFQNYEQLQRRGYATWGKVIVENSNRDLAIVHLDSLPEMAREIDHDFGTHLSRNIRIGDPVHILGNPGKLDLWRWTLGLFHTENRDWLIINADVYGGNSGGPVLNEQGKLIGIITLSDKRTKTWAVPARHIKALLDTLRPRHTFKIRNPTGVTVPYEIKWTPDRSWRRYSLKTNFVRTHSVTAENVPQGYPKIRFDYIAGDQRVTYRTHKLNTFLQFGENNDVTPTYFFKYNRRGDRLNLFIESSAAPALSKTIPQETVLLSNYPNPSNPETWIPYQLAKAAKVTLTIHAVDGRLIRILVLGLQPAGMYHRKSRAAYWDGRNELGEPVASGVYFYTLKAGELTATRKMLIRK